MWPFSRHQALKRHELFNCRILHLTKILVILCALDSSKHPYKEKLHVGSGDVHHIACYLFWNNPVRMGSKDLWKLGIVIRYFFFCKQTKLDWVPVIRTYHLQYDFLHFQNKSRTVKLLPPKQNTLNPSLPTLLQFWTNWSFQTNIQ